MSTNRLPSKSRSLTELQIDQLANALHHGAAEASTALARWLNAVTTMSINSIDQCPLKDAARVLGDGDQAVCMSLMEMQGWLTGHMLLAFDDTSGLAVADLLQTQPEGTAIHWGEVERSCIMETLNIAGSAYLNGIAKNLSERSGRTLELIPTSPIFIKDFAESLLESAFMDQAVAGNDVVFALATFELSGKPLRWTFLLIPDPASLQRLSEILASLS